MYATLCPKERFPHGHPSLALALRGMGALLVSQGSYKEASEYLRRALEMQRALYDKDRYANGHPYLALTIGSIGRLLEAQGNYNQARVYRQESLDIYEAIYPQRQYPRGHGLLISSLISMGNLLQIEGKYEGRKCYVRALELGEAYFTESCFPEVTPLWRPDSIAWDPSSSR